MSVEPLVVPEECTSIENYDIYEKRRWMCFVTKNRSKFRKAIVKATGKYHFNIVGVFFGVACYDRCYEPKVPVKLKK